MFDVVDELTMSRVPVPVTPALKEGRRVLLPGPNRLRRRDGSSVAIEQIVAPLGEGASLGAVVVFRDVSHRLKAELASKERIDFEEKLVGIVSHDLRNPLNVILLGVSALLEEPDLDPGLSKTVKRIRTSAERATRLVNDLLDFTQARLGNGIPVTRQPSDVHQIARQVVEEMQAAFPKRQLRRDGSGDGAGEWDPDRIAQLLTNLISNALKYGLPDSVVSVRSFTDGPWVCLSVHNSGSPIPPHLVEVMFEPMRRGALDRADRSVGLGLYIVKHIVEVHGGSIAVTSNETDGTTFTVRLPRRFKPAAP